MAQALKDKVAVVTGAGRGIGKGIALLMAQEGAKVVVNDPGVEVGGTGGSSSIADQVVQEIRSAGGQGVANYESVASMKGGQSIVQTALDTFGRLDIVATPAGILRDRMIFNMSEEEWDAVIAVHLKGTFTVVRHAAPIFRQQRSGRIITFSSESGLIGNPSQSNYGAAKTGIAGFTWVIAREMGRYGVTCNCIVPRAYTRMTVGVPELAKQLSAQGKALTEFMNVFTPVEEWDPNDVAPFVTYLASDQASDINGQTFLVYGGVVALMSQPQPVKTLFKDGRWTMDELTKAVPKTLAHGLVNPAPPER